MKNIRNADYPPSCDAVSREVNSDMSLSNIRKNESSEIVCVKKDGCLPPSCLD